MEKSYPDLIEIIKIGTTYEGRDIVLAKISKNVKTADEKPAMLFTGSIHAREWIGHELALKFIEDVVKNQNVDPKLSKSLTESTIYMVPCLNPDGYEYSRKYFSFWRKNRRPNHDGSIGVDLNRNFSIGFVKQKDTSSNVYGGEKPFSEAETSAIKEFVDTHDNITIAFDYHSQGNVFFPAHKFKHEPEIDGTDMNVLCANMNDEFSKVTGRKYGIHRGKPPAKLISGSGREYYYSKGIIAVVVEVGTKNISDYMKSMTGSIKENIPALKMAFEEAINYSAQAPSRVSEFTIKEYTANSVTLEWKYELRDDIFFEIYRSTKDKDACNERTKVGIVGENMFEDSELTSSTNYYYTIRAVNKTTGYKSPFAPMVKVRTSLDESEFFKMIFASKDTTGYVGEKTQERNRSHFGSNSLFAGISKSRGICNSVVSFNLNSIPKNAIIKSARFYIYPMNRVAAKIEKYGEWNLALLKEDSFSEVTDFIEIENAEYKSVIGRAIQSSNLTQGIWNHWAFSKHECSLLEESLEEGVATFRLDGPKTLPLGEDSQMMQFDIGYGKFGGGINHRPMLDITYTVKEEKIKLKAAKTSTFYVDEKVQGLKSGFDADGKRIYGYMKFDLSNLPDPKHNIITSCTLKINPASSHSKKYDIYYYVELVELDEVDSYEDIINRDKIEYIGYEVAKSDLVKNEYNYFNFDTFSKSILDTLYQKGEKLKLVIKPRSSSSNVKNRVATWNDDVELIVNYIEKSRIPMPAVENVKITKENKMIKLSWDKVNSNDLKGYYVVRNSFHPPRNFLDGDKIYGGADTWTYDNYGSFDKEKYYAVYAYDNVPNYSDPTIIKYNPLEKY